MIIRKPIMQRRRKKQGLVQIVGAETLTHEHILKANQERSRPLRGRLNLSPTNSVRCKRSIPISWLFIDNPNSKSMEESNIL